MTRINELQDLHYFKGGCDVTSMKLFDLLNIDNNFDYRIIVSVKK